MIDKTAADWPASIAATGLALACYPVSVERGFMSWSAAVERTLATLRFFWGSPQGSEPDATGYRGFYYHFLDMQTGRRAWQCELSTVGSAFLLAGKIKTIFRCFGSSVYSRLRAVIITAYRHGHTRVSMISATIKLLSRAARQAHCEMRPMDF